MSGQAILVMVVVGGFVWGGFLALLIRALLKEGAKQRRADSDDQGVDPATGLR